ncbi:cell division protein ZapA [Stutzerimonas stutzeri]|uniref:cell division protein ZapA n=1 Tax=Stutzerimonas sp. S1 TaxID=3030652 RepID=UPI0022243D78|nr:cell division protein ZapA [Stutzerimonas sp. S1]MCW3149008.1 cell division protein ZapA [Stutzerimonas sp. S1]
MKDEGIQILKVLGRDYSIRAAEGQGTLLSDAAALLQEHLEASRRLFPGASSDKLLVLTALNLCAPLLEQGEQLRAAEQRLIASVERITSRLRG